MQQIMLDPHLCFIDPLINARSGDGGDLAGLKAQIRQNGFTDPLWVMSRAKKYSIIDGGRRWRAFLEIAAEDGLKKPGKIPVSLFDVDDATAVEMSLAAFLERDALTPHDEAVQFTRLKLAGVPEAEIAARFACSERLVRQRIAIGSLPQAILAALRDGAIDIGTAQHFTSAAAERALSVFNDLKKTKSLNRYAVDAALTDGTVAGHDRRCVFVGAHAYEAAGGVISRDLFSDTAMWHDAGLLDALFEAKLEATAQALKDEGWSFVDILRKNAHVVSGWGRSVAKETRELSRAEKAELKKLQAQHKALETEYATLDDLDTARDLSASEQERYGALPDVIAALAEKIAALDWPLFSPRQMAKAGCVITAEGHGGRVEILRGLLKPGKKSAASHSDEDGEAEDRSAAAATEHPQPVETVAYSEALTASLEAVARNATKLAMVAHVPLLTYRMGLAARIIAAGFRHDAPFAVSHNSSPSGAAYEALRLDAFRPFGLKSDDEADEDISHVSVTARLEGMNPEDLIRIEAFLAADLFRVSSLKNPDVAAVISLIDPDMGAEGWKPGAEFMGRLNRAQLTATIAEIDAQAAIPAVLKKPELAALAADLAELHGWWPAPLRTPSYKGPGSNAWADARAAQLADAITRQQAAE